MKNTQATWTEQYIFLAPFSAHGKGFHGSAFPLTSKAQRRVNIGRIVNKG
jgi:hypothetical protein